MKVVVATSLAMSLLVLARISYGQIISGRVAAVEEQENGLRFLMQTGRMKLKVRSPSVIHVIYSPHDTFAQRENPMLPAGRLLDHALDIGMESGVIYVSN
jgi:hypothetical protein